MASRDRGWKAAQRPGSPGQPARRPLGAQGPGCCCGGVAGGHVQPPPDQDAGCFLRAAVLWLSCLGAISCLHSRGEEASRTSLGRHPGRQAYGESPTAQSTHFHWPERETGTLPCRGGWETWSSWYPGKGDGIDGTLPISAIFSFKTILTN